MTSASDPILKLVDLKKHYRSHVGTISRALGVHDRPVLAVDGVDLAVERGETLGLVGESGCGKSTLGRTALLLEKPTSGQAIFDGVNLVDLPEGKLRYTRRRMQMVFQDPAASLNPRKTVRSILDGSVRLWKAWDASSGAGELVELVGLSSDSLTRYPHQFSGGQKQRIGIARALASRPELIVADEPVASLDVSVQAQILRLLMELQEKLGLSYLFISHDIEVVRKVSDRVAVMYLGRLVELGSAQDVVESPLHPYTRALISAIPTIHGKQDRIVLGGEVPDPANPPSGCRFHPRCFVEKAAQCRNAVPELIEVAPGRLVACHRLES